MESTEMESREELIVYESSMRIPYRWAAGTIAARFYRELAQQQLWGTRCPRSQKVLFPPRKNCNCCLQETTDWVTVGPQATVTSFTVARYNVALLNEPTTYALLRLDGADTAFIHRLKEVDPTQLHIGMRVTAVFAVEPQGNILDIDYFRPV
jgi:uncharacterized protein